jgi:hypothetical protein
MGAERLSMRRVWLVRALWAVMVVILPPAVEQALVDRSGAVQWTVAASLWFGWAVVLLGLLVPSSPSLTLVRVAMPAAPAVAVASAVAGADPIKWWTAFAVSLLAAALALTAEFGEVFVQASAYGAERRFLLRPPTAMVIVACVTWALWAAALSAGTLLVAADRWPIGAPLVVVGLALSFVMATGGHRLTRRWLVFVPAGLVLHDHLVLAETAMLRRSEVEHVHLASAETEAADLTGGALGPAIEVDLTQLIAVVLNRGRDGSSGIQIHLRSFLVCPTRPGRVMAHAAPLGLS